MKNNLCTNSDPTLSQEGRGGEAESKTAQLQFALFWQDDEKTHLYFSPSWSPAQRSQLGHLRRVHKMLLTTNTKLFPKTVPIISISHSITLLSRKKIFFVLMMNKLVLRIARGNHHQHLIVLPSPKQFWIWEEMSELSATLLVQK